MFLVNLAIAFVPAVLLWYFGSWAMARLFLRAEPHGPSAGRHGWGGLELVLTIAVFVLSVAAWFGLAFLLERFNP